MSTFVDGSASEDILNTLRQVQARHRLSFAYFMACLLEVAAHIALNWADHWRSF